MNRFIAAALLSTLLATLAWAAAASAAVEEKNEVSHLFNATLSLTGGCGASTADPVEDPGCPGGTHPPEGKIVWPSGVATDRFGDIYVVNRNSSEGRNSFHIDIFDPTGHYISEVARAQAEEAGPVNVAVDSSGHLYVFDVFSGMGAGGPELLRYDPTVYKPEAGEIEYGSSPIPLRTDVASAFAGLGIDPTDDHVYVRFAGDPAVSEYGPAVDGVPNELLAQSIGAGVLGTEGLDGSNIALNASRHRLYVTTNAGSGTRGVVRVFSTEAPYELLETIDGSNTPIGKFKELGWRLSVAVDEASGEIIVGDTYGAKKAYVFGEDGEYVETIKNPTLEAGDFVSIAVDNSPESPNQGFLFVPSGGSGAAGHLFAYEPKPIPVTPVVEAVSVSDVGEEEAILQATINPKGLATDYSFEYVTQQAFEAEGFEGAQVAGEGTLKAGNEGKGVSAPAAGLLPGTEYRFRAVAESQCEPGGCRGEAQGTFTTFTHYAQSGSCPNQALRTGSSAALPDCRAYELVTPADTGGQATYGLGVTGGPQWPSPPASPDGSSFAYMILGGIIPGVPGANPAFNGAGYLSDRTATGWRTEALGPDGTQASESNPGALSPDHGFYAVEAYELGSLLLSEEGGAYVRHPDGSFHLLDEDPSARVKYISDGGSHIVYSSQGGIYDLTPDGLAHHLGIGYLGVSADGSTVALRNGGSSIFLSVDDEGAIDAAPSGSTFAGLSADGRYLFYLQGGDAYRFDSQSEETARITETGDATLVNVASEGTGAYFLSAEALGVGPNPNGEEPVGGGPNLYYWDGTTTRFLATVTEADVEGDLSNNGIPLEILGGWTDAVGQQIAMLGSRTSPQGSTLLFRSRAELTGFDSGGKAEIYRYDAAEGTLRCLSCDPTGAAPGGDASLLSVNPGAGTVGAHTPPSSYSLIPNLSADGRRAFFQTAERLVPADNDGLIDVYEWEAQGKGSCAVSGGCLFLISSGRSAHDNYLFGASVSGDDVFISSSDLLVPEDADETPSVYDARVGGGFPPGAEVAGECLGEACQPAAVAPEDATPASDAFRGQGNVRPPAARHCRKGRRLSHRGGKTRCAPRHPRKRRHHHHRRAHRRSHANRRAHR